MIIWEGKDRVYLGSAVQLVSDDREMAWAERSYRRHPAMRHFVGRYVQSDKANSNRQLWTLADLQDNYETIKGTGVNWAHNPRKVLGSYIDAELLYPKSGDEHAADSVETPFVETLGSLWPYNFPEEYELIKAAQDEGHLYQSMECVSQSVTCVGDGGCGETFAYKGPRDASYCSCLNERKSDRQLNNPTFLGGALLVPPIAPGWKNARIMDLSAMLKDHAEQLDDLREGLEVEFAHLTPKEWDSLMTLVIGLG